MACELTPRSHAIDGAGVRELLLILINPAQDSRLLWAGMG
jgi:hypothetical protein